jgi:hypothetical protein
MFRDWLAAPCWLPGTKLPSTTQLRNEVTHRNPIGCSIQIKTGAHSVNMSIKKERDLLIRTSCGETRHLAPLPNAKLVSTWSGQRQHEKARSMCYLSHLPIELCFSKHWLQFLRIKGATIKRNAANIAKRPKNF